MILIRILFVFLCFFPYWSIYPLGLGLQPYAGSFALTLFLLQFLLPMKLERQHLIFSTVVVFTSLILYILSHVYPMRTSGPLAPFNAERSLLNVLFFWAIFYISRYDDRMTGVLRSLLPYVVLMTACIVVVQLLYDKNFTTSLLEVSTGNLENGRGVTGTAPEPTFFGIQCIFIYLLCRKLQLVRTGYGALLLVFTSLSTTAIFCTLPILAVKMMRRPFIGALAIMITLGILSMSSDSPLDGTRVGSFIADPFLIFSDVSALLRISNITIPLFGSFNMALVPQGYIIPVALENRFLSLASGIIFELGFIGILLIGFIIRESAVKGADRLTLICTLFTSVQLSLPALVLLVGSVGEAKINSNRASLRGGGLSDSPQ